jgi:hypothetical protein
MHIPENVLGPSSNNHVGSDELRLVTAQMIEPSSRTSGESSKRCYMSEPVSGRDPKPNCDDFVRSLNEFASVLERQGIDQADRLRRLKQKFHLMGLSSRESASQLVDYLMGVLSPLSDAMPPDHKRTRPRQ